MQGDVMDRLNREILGASEGRTMKYTPKKDSWSPLIQTLQISSCLSGSLQPLLYYLYIFVLLVVFLLCFPLKCTHFCCRASLTWRRKSGSKAASTALAKTGPPCCASATISAALSPSLGTAPSWLAPKRPTRPTRPTGPTRPTCPMSCPIVHPWTCSSTSSKQVQIYATWDQISKILWDRILLKFGSLWDGNLTVEKLFDLRMLLKKCCPWPGLAKLAPSP